MQQPNLRLLLTLFCFFIFTSIQAQLSLPRIFSDHMVLQRETPVTIWGWAKPKAKIKVELADQTKETRAAKDGSWKVQLNPMQAGGPYELVVTSRREAFTFRDVLFGEVWLCSGQSNMEFSLKMLGKEKAIAQANNPNLRLFQVDRRVAFQPKSDLESGQWALTNPGSVTNFSGVGYFFGKKLQEELDVPIGLIQSAWGGTVAETWISPTGANTIDYYRDNVQELATFDAAAKEAEMRAQYQDLLDSFGPEKSDGLVNGQALWAAPEYDDGKWADMELPGLWEGKGLNDLDGVVWFRKEVDLSMTDASKDFILELGPIDDDDKTWVNGKLVGEMEQAYNTPRVYKVPAAVLRPGKNVITVRVNDTGGGGGVYGSPEQMKMGNGTNEISLAGNWKYRLSPQLVKFNSSLTGPNSQPTLLFNGMIQPLIPYALQGVIWYQGESNAGRAYEYRKIFPLLIKDWRTYWGEELDFYFVQLANYRAPKENPDPSDWAELREAQDMTLELPRTGMAVIIDIGEADDIHPRNKEDVGLRLALQALHKNYGRDLVYQGPTFRSAEVVGDKMVIRFDHTGSGLVAKGKYGYPKGFIIAGADKKFHWAQARILGDKIEVYHPNVPKPVAVRYAWADNPHDVNLYNKEGLPAAPFRTDDWPGMTKGVINKY